MALDASVFRRSQALAVYSQGIDKSLRELGALDKLLGGREAIIRQAADEVAPLMKAMLQQNFAGAGLQSHTDTLAGAVAAAQITLVSSGLKATMGTGSYGKTPVERVAGALNYGAVHQPRPHRLIRQTVGGSTIQGRYGNKGILGDKAKRTIKKIALCLLYTTDAADE